MSPDDLDDFNYDPTPFEASEDPPDIDLALPVSPKPPVGITRKIDNLTRMWTSEMSDSRQVSRYEEFYTGTALGLDRLINELTVLRVMLSEEAAKPSRGAKVDMRGRPKRSDEAITRQFLHDNLSAFFAQLDGENAFLDEMEKAYLVNEVGEALIRPVMKYATTKIQEFLDQVDESKFRNPDVVIKLADSITKMEKARQAIEDQLSKMKVEARVAAIIYQILVVLRQKCPDQIILRDVAKGLEDIIKAENLEISMENL